MKQRSNWNIMFRLAKLVKPLSGYMVLAVLMGVAGNLAASLITVFGGYAILEILGFSVPMFAVLAFILAGALALARGILRYAEQACNHFIAFKLLALIRDKVFQALRRLCPAKLEGRDKGDLISVITSDIELLEVFYAHTISPVLIAAIFSGLMVAFIAVHHLLLGALALIAFFVVGVVIPLIASKTSGNTGEKFRRDSGKLSAFVLDSLRGLTELLQFGQKKQRMAQMEEQTGNLSETEKKMKNITGTNMAVTGAVILVFDILMLILAAILYCAGQVDFVGVVIPVLALMSSFGPVVALANLGSTLQNTFASGNRVLDILDETPVVEDVVNGKNVEFHGAAAENVTFAYEDETILKDVSVTIPKNRIVGISGKSGSGKSTLLRLFMRFWSVDSGVIKVSGENIEEINTKNLRDLQSFVTQDTHLFHDSIANNLRIAKLDATDEELIAACKKASIHDFIMQLPEGYNTQVGELGDTLSGGERQRLGIARAFLHDADLLLLDEPTSNLDSLNEAVILKSVCESADGKTVVLISHRASTMRVADQVYSVENGRMS